MKLASYVHHGRKSYGILTDTGIIDLGGKIGHQYRTLKDLLQWGAIEIAGQYVNYPVDVMMADITFYRSLKIGENFLRRYELCGKKKRVF